MQLNLSIAITYDKIHVDNTIDMFGFFFAFFLWKNECKWWNHFNCGMRILVLANFEVCSYFFFFL